MNVRTEHAGARQHRRDRADRGLSRRIIKEITRMRRRVEDRLVIAEQIGEAAS